MLLIPWDHTDAHPFDLSKLIKITLFRTDGAALADHHGLWRRNGRKGTNQINTNAILLNALTFFTFTFATAPRKKTKLKNEKRFFWQRLIIRFKETGRGLTTRWTNESGKNTCWWKRGGNGEKKYWQLGVLIYDLKMALTLLTLNSTVECVLTHLYNQPLKMLAYKPLYYFHSPCFFSLSSLIVRSLRL